MAIDTKEAQELSENYHTLESFFIVCSEEVRDIPKCDHQWLALWVQFSMAQRSRGFQIERFPGSLSKENPADPTAIRVPGLQQVSVGTRATNSIQCIASAAAARPLWEDRKS